MPWADPEKNAEAVRRWREAHPGYWRRYATGVRNRLACISRYAALDEDVKQQAELYRLSHRKAECPELYRQRERRWIQATDFWSGDAADGQGAARRRAFVDDEASA